MGELVVRYIITEKINKLIGVTENNFWEILINLKNFTRIEKFYLRPTFKILKKKFIYFKATFVNDCLYIEYQKRKGAYNGNVMIMEIYKNGNEYFIVRLQKAQSFNKINYKLKGIDNLRNRLEFLCELSFKK